MRPRQRLQRDIGHVVDGDEALDPELLRRDVARGAFALRQDVRVNRDTRRDDGGRTRVFFVATALHPRTIQRFRREGADAAFDFLIRPRAWVDCTCLFGRVLAGILRAGGESALIVT